MSKRKLFVFDPKRIDEQAMRNHAMRLIERGVDTEVEIHLHDEEDNCCDGAVELTNIKNLLDPGLAGLCYKYTDKTIGIGVK